MCSIDLEPCALWSHSTGTARKAGPCFICGWVIPAGAPFGKYVWKFEGEFGNARLCLGCELIADDFATTHGTMPTPDIFEETLRECFEGADRGDPEAKPWRDAMAEILKRQRAASRARAAA